MENNNHIYLFEINYIPLIVLLFSQIISTKNLDGFKKLRLRSDFRILKLNATDMTLVPILITSMRCLQRLQLETAQECVCTEIVGNHLNSYHLANLVPHKLEIPH